MSWLKLEVLLCLAIYAAIIGVFVVGRILAKRKEIKATAEQNVRNITVLVPFRNEKDNLRELIRSIQNLSVLPKEFIFINDHSTDDFESSFAGFDYPYRILHVNPTKKGKKAAIELGVQAATTSFILTWDADITVSKDYFYELEKWQWMDLNILPVHMLGPELVSGFFAMDYQLQTQANVALSGFYRPITASGANLLFNKQVFLELSKHRKDTDIPSGDDQFLLKAVRKAGRNISVLTNAQLKVETQAPKTVASGLQQRRRWLGKSAKVADHFATSFGLVVFLVQMAFYGFAVYQSVIGAWGATIVMVLIKGELDAFLSTYKFQEQFTTINVFLYQVVYPFYILSLLFSAFLPKNSWKGRTV